MEFSKQRMRKAARKQSKAKRMDLSGEVSQSVPTAATGVFSFKAGSLTRKSFSPIMESSGNQSPMIADSYNIKNLSTIGDDPRKKTPLGVVSQARYQTL